MRLRYFFGQRLGVVDLADEQSYVVGKQRLHNLRLHGVGVLCGLRSERYVFPQGMVPTTATTLLRVRRGAALDGCGREIVVGWDQCIDVDAWFAKHQTAMGPISGPLRLWVALCYRECPSDPSPAPRDPCGCDSGGCEFARIRESFELKLLTDTEAKPQGHSERMAGADSLLAAELLTDSLEAALGRIEARRVGEDCPMPDPEGCLLLASFQATLDATSKKVINISEPDNAIVERTSLLRTEELQRLLLRLVAAAGNAELLADGPRLGAVTFAGTATDAGVLSIAIEADGGALTQDPFPAGQVTVGVHRFKTPGTWEAAPAFTASYKATPSPRFDLTWVKDLVADARYRIVIQTDRDQPPVDAKMRLLTPTTWARHIHLVQDAGKLSLATTLFP